MTNKKDEWIRKLWKRGIHDVSILARKLGYKPRREMKEKDTITEQFACWLGIEHKHTFIPAISDSGHEIEICRFCRCHDGVKFWAELNRKYYEQYPPNPHEQHEQTS